MTAKNCPECHINWSPIELYRSTFGSTAQRPANDTCPICGTPTRVTGGYQSSPGEIQAARDAYTRQLEYDAKAEEFEDYYLERALKELEEWLSLERA